ncbi:MAG: hypothetical protein M1823_002757 [Watsoniomyces obsoletus]|nr:MAG: hypothetical protein M1823_002757 [Watsoniomyces obsoletus]
MAARSGEELVASVFADIHYYFSPPTAKPLHHRFDKGSYVYLFRNASTGQTRLELANQAGTPEQDAVSGYVTAAQMQNSERHPTLCSFAVESRSYDGAGSPQPQQQEQQWHLPGLDQRNEGRYMFKLHSLDIYFWTKEDATSVVEAVRGVNRSTSVKGPDEPKPALPTHHGTTSPVVQQLEKMAITGSGDKPASRHSNEGTAIASSQRHSGGPTTGTQASPVQTTQKPVDQAPMPYNPAAPAAPEPIRHREKTPPPPDATDGTGLHHAAAQDAGGPYSTPSIQHQNSFPPPPPANQAHQQGHPPSFPGPPQQQPSYHGATPSGAAYHGTQASPAPSTGSFAPPPHTSSFASYPSHDAGYTSGGPVPSYTATSPGTSSYPSQAVTSPTVGAYPTQGSPAPSNQPYSPPPQHGGYAPPPVLGSGYSSGAPHYFSPAATPGATPGQGHVTSPYGAVPTPPPGTHDGGHHAAGYPPTSQPYFDPNQQHQQYPGSVPPTGGYPPTSQPPGGYSSYQYGQPQQQMPPGQPASIHSQVYQPTQVEAGSYKPAAPAGQGRLTAGTAKLEKGVGRFLKKVEKKIG